MHSRTTRLGHPPPLYRDKSNTQPSQRLIYGPGVNAPWNTSTGLSVTAPTPTTAKLKDGSALNGLPNGKESVIAKTLPDAKLHATWDYESKRYNEALSVGRRGRMGSMSGLTLSIGGRAPSESRVV